MTIPSSCPETMSLPDGSTQTEAKGLAVKERDSESEKKRDGGKSLHAFKLPTFKPHYLLVQPLACYPPEGEFSTVIGVEALRSQNLAVLSWLPLANIHPPQVWREYTCPEERI